MIQVSWGRWKLQAAEALNAMSIWLNFVAIIVCKQGDYKAAMEKFDSAVTIQEALFDVPHEKLKSLKEKQEIFSLLSSPETTQELQMKIEVCEKEIAQAKQSTNLRLQNIMEIINSSAS